MKQLALVFATTLLTGQAIADHHIEHVYGHLDSAEHSLNKVRNAASLLPVCENWTPTQVQFATHDIFTYIEAAQERIDETREDLQAAQSTYAMIQGGGDVTVLEAQLKDELHAARSHLTQPAWPNNDNPNSGEFLMGYTIVVGKYFIEDWRVGEDSAMCAEAGKRVAEIMLNSAVALRWLNIAAWHVFDATLEMVYEDEDFICAGPNNHCD